jgi:hypothetical protein
MRVARTQKGLAHRNTLGLRKLKLFFQCFPGKAGSDAQRAIAAVDYTLRIAGRVVDKGQTAADGSIELLLPAGLAAELEIFGTKYDLTGTPWLEPVADVIGQQRRLSMMGYAIGNPDGTAGEKTDRSALEFQADQGLGPDGVIGGGTRGKLTSEFGE